MSEDSEVAIEVVNILEAGKCPYGHQVGENINIQRKEEKFVTSIPFNLSLYFRN
jgi:uncharacterized repeat protein (TIGR04076 family)